MNIGMLEQRLKKAEKMAKTLQTTLINKKVVSKEDIEESKNGEQ